MLGNFAAEEYCFLLLAEGERAQRAHAPFANHLACNFRGTLDIVSRASSDVMQEDFFGGTATHQNAELRFEKFLGVGVLIVDGQLHGDAQSHTARNDGDFVKRIRAGSQGGNQCVSSFVIRRVPFLFVRQNHGPALDTHEDFVFRHFEVGHGDEFAVLPRGPES